MGLGNWRISKQLSRSWYSFISKPHGAIIDKCPGGLGNEFGAPTVPTTPSDQRYVVILRVCSDFRTFFLVLESRKYSIFKRKIEKHRYGAAGAAGLQNSPPKESTWPRLAPIGPNLAPSGPDWPLIGSGWPRSAPTWPRTAPMGPNWVLINRLIN